MGNGVSIEIKFLQRYNKHTFGHLRLSLLGLNEPVSSGEEEEEEEEEEIDTKDTSVSPAVQKAVGKVFWCVVNV